MKADASIYEGGGVKGTNSSSVELIGTLGTGGVLAALFRAFGCILTWLSFVVTLLQMTTTVQPIKSDNDTIPKIVQRMNVPKLGFSH